MSCGDRVSPTVLAKRSSVERPTMPAVADAVTAGDLLSLRDRLVEEVEERLMRVSSSRLRSGCTMVCLMWQAVLVATAPKEADSIARCMLIDTLALLEKV